MHHVSPQEMCEQRSLEMLSVPFIKLTAVFNWSCKAF